MKVVKRDGSVVDFDHNKIVAAVTHVTDAERGKQIAEGAYWSFKDSVTVEELQDYVESEIAKTHFDAAREYVLYREKRSRLRQRPGNELSDYILHSKYARDGESWEDVVARNALMHTERWPELKYAIWDAYEYVLKKDVLPSMRSLQFAGDGIREHNARMYNCSFSHCNRIEFFRDLYYLLLAGCGVGYSVQRHHVDELPAFKEQSIVTHWKVEDSIEGWAFALGRLMFGASQGEYVEFDYSGIRPAGARISSGGLAPGHIPLKNCLEAVRRRLSGHTTPIQAHDICCLVAESVLSGGIRRSSMIALFDRDDTEMMDCKTGDWPAHRAMANNSVVWLREWSRDGYDDIFERTKQFGEPGIFFTNSKEHGTNPCGEIGLEPAPNGFQFCNLTEVNATSKDFIGSCKAAAFIGTLQAAYTDFKWMHSTEDRCRRDALLGVSLTGVVDADLTSVMLIAGRETVKEENARVSKIIGINPARRTTCVKPSGTASLLLGCVGSGIHNHPGKFYIRRITANAREQCFIDFQKANPHACVLKPNGDWVVEFPVACNFTPESDIAFMERVFNTYEDWIGSGHLTHNISCTVEVTDWLACMDYLWDKQIPMAFFESTGQYAFQPREVCEQNGRWLELVERFQEVDYSAGYKDNGGACDGGSCEI